MAFSSMYAGASGLVAQSTGMSVIANNIANMDTVGYKESRTLFSDVMSTTVTGGSISQNGTVSSTGQVGNGVTVADVQTIFSQGSFTGTNTSTDLAINGDGFFGVMDTSDNTVSYTRAGNFTFDKYGSLVSTSGMQVQGYAYNSETETYSSQISGIQLPYEEVEEEGEIVRQFISNPQATSAIDMSVNLDADAVDLSSDPDNPYFSLVSEYDGTSTPPIDPDDVSYTASITVYDSEGNSHEVQVSYDPVTTSNASGNKKIWEYMVTVDPSEDGRTNTQNTSAAGLVMAGTITFDSDGTMISQSAYTLDPTATEVKNLSNWGAASFSTDGIPEFNIAFLNEDGTTTESQSISIDFGMQSTTGEWSGGSNANAGAVGTDSSNLIGFGTDYVHEATATSSYPYTSATISQAQDGYDKGYLTGIETNLDGEMIGIYSNGQEQAFYKVAMYDFKNEFGLRSEGGNMYTATVSSGNAIAGEANEDGLGSISQNSLEASTVDLATQFSEMIIGQRAFQASSKVITTSDSMLNTLQQIKR